jgi:hypothetical protein
MLHPGVRLSSAAAIVFALAAFADAATLYVANNGLDGSNCGTKTNPCRSIDEGIANAAAGDSVVVGPGRYGDLNPNGILGEPGEENPALVAPGWGCVGLEKSVSVVSSDGAASTVIDGRSVPVIQNVAIVVPTCPSPSRARVSPSRRRQRTTAPDSASMGRASRVEGNQVINTQSSSGGSGILTVINDGNRSHRGEPGDRVDSRGCRAQRRQDGSKEQRFSLNSNGRWHPLEPKVT